MTPASDGGVSPPAPPRECPKFTVAGQATSDRGKNELGDYPAASLSTTTDRRSAALDLVNRFYRQIRHGCLNPACNFPTCLSCQKRRTKGPFRRFTVLSARALATFLASEDDAEQRLCHYPPAKESEPQDRAFPKDDSVNPGGLKETVTVHAKTGQQASDTTDANRATDSERVIESITGELEQDSWRPANVRTPAHNSEVHLSEPSQQACILGDKEHPAQSQSLRKKAYHIKEKDSKSFSQNVFDTQAFILSEVVNFQNGMPLLLSNDITVRANKADANTPDRDSRITYSGNTTDKPFSETWRELGKIFTHDRTVRQKANARNLQDSEAADIFLKTLRVLANECPVFSCNPGPSVWETFVGLRKCGRFLPYGTTDRQTTAALLELMDFYDDEMTLRISTRLAHAFASRHCWSEISRCKIKQRDCSVGPELSFTDIVMQKLKDIAKTESHNTTNIGIIDSASIILESLCGVVLHKWDGNVEIERFGAVGGALDFMSCLYEARQELSLSSELFYMPVISQRLDSMETPVDWLPRKASRKMIHLLSFPFLFPPETLVTYFRAVNFASMNRALETSIATGNLLMRMSNIARDERVQERLKIATNTYLVLDIRRDRILSDALDQLWKRQKRELLRPLKIRMGMDEGEEGVDHGGVQQEFFRLAVAEALNPDYGLFTTDSRTRMTWFRPCPLEQSYRFELLGLLMSLAIYNGLTLPVTFPLAFYSKLLGVPIMALKDIQDGWPDLAKGLADLLSWSEGDVEDVFVRSYVFTIDTILGPIHVDMEQHGRDTEEALINSEPQLKHTIPSNGSGPLRNGSVMRSPSMSSQHTGDNSSEDWVCLSNDPDADSTRARLSNSQKTHGLLPSDSDVEEASMVTNQNREQYVIDYIFWLTDRSIREQYEAFARGFYLCLDKKALSMFSPEALQDVVQGNRNIDVAKLEKITKYEGGYSAESRVIQDFWFVVRSFSEDQVRKLLEFVTSSDRIPVKGVTSIAFMIQRSGTSDERLPTSMTCFGRLLLPEYSSREKLRERICLAIENSQGFGVA